MTADFQLSVSLVARAYMIKEFLLSGSAQAGGYCIAVTPM
jgi:hypothetical protein